MLLRMYTRAEIIQDLEKWLAEHHSDIDLACDADGSRSAEIAALTYWNKLVEVLGRLKDTRSG